jgi:hypothetical protein
MIRNEFMSKGTIAEVKRKYREKEGRAERLSAAIACRVDGLPFAATQLNGIPARRNFTRSDATKGRRRPLISEIPSGEVARGHGHAPMSREGRSCLNY